MNSTDIWAIGGPVVPVVQVDPAGLTEGADPTIKGDPIGRVDLIVIATADFVT